MKVQTNARNKMPAKDNKGTEVRENFKDQRPVRRTKLEQVKYIKTFDNFHDGIEQMIQLSADINRLFTSKDNIGYSLNTVDDGMKAVLNIFTSHFPSIENRENIHYDLNISANKCSLKTDKFISFGWYIKTNRNEDKITRDYIFHIIVFGDRKYDLVNNLTEAGWAIDTYTR